MTNIINDTDLSGFLNRKKSIFEMNRENSQKRLLIFSWNLKKNLFINVLFARLQYKSRIIRKRLNLCHVQKIIIEFILKWKKNVQQRILKTKLIIRIRKLEFKKQSICNLLFILNYSLFEISFIIKNSQKIPLFS